MKKTYVGIFIFLTVSITFLVGRSFRVSKLPHGSKFSCNTCHTNGGGTPLNPFGVDVNSRVTPGGNETFWGLDLASLDSDGDGFTNGEELQDPTGAWIEGDAQPGDENLVTNPGDPNSHPPVVSVEDDINVAKNFILYNNYPNPFSKGSGRNPFTRISFNIPTNSHVKLEIYNIQGVLVNELINGVFSPGKYKAIWNGRNESGEIVSSGVYLYRLTANNFVLTKRMLLIK